MKRLVAALVVCSLCTPVLAAGFPESVAYRGHAVESDGATFTGTRAVEVEYFEGDEAIWKELFPAVPFAGGRFDLTLGGGRIDAAAGGCQPLSSSKNQ